MARRPRDPQWYKDAIVYETHVRAFFDRNNDGVGDFPGLIEKLDYLQDLGITCLWLLPFFPAPRRPTRPGATCTSGATRTRSTGTRGSPSPTPRSRTGRGIPRRAPTSGI